MYGLRGPWGLTAVLQLIYELRKNCCGRVDGTGIEGSIRGPRGPKNEPDKIPNNSKKVRTKCPTNHLVFLPLVFCLHTNITFQALLNWWMHFIPPIKSLQKFPKSSTTSSWYANLSTVVSWKHMWPHIITSSPETFHEHGKKEEEYSCFFFLTSWQQRF